MGRAIISESRAASFRYEGRHHPGTGGRLPQESTLRISENRESLRQNHSCVFERMYTSRACFANSAILSETAASR
jgi:hypothetical protein